jgi:pSer/pThr/pTyr-binding forkhead associated (FHA) protein
VIVIEPLSPPGPPRSFLRAFTIGAKAPPGASLPATWQLDDPAASPLHCVIAPRPGGWAVKDLGSPGGTRVNGLRVSSSAGYPLHRGDRVTVGATELVVIPDPP